MFPLLHFIQTLLDRARRAQDPDQDFLAHAQDMQDLELRMRALDERDRNPSGGIAFGLYAC